MNKVRILNGEVGHKWLWYLPTLAFTKRGVPPSLFSSYSAYTHKYTNKQTTDLNRITFLRKLIKAAVAYGVDSGLVGGVGCAEKSLDCQQVGGHCCRLVLHNEQPLLPHTHHIGYSVTWTATSCAQ